MGDLRFSVSDLLGHPGQRRDVYGEVKLFLKVGETSTRSSSATFAHLTAVGEGILAEGWSGIMADHVCVRCLREWEGPVATEWMAIAQAFAGPPGPGRDPLPG